MPPPYAGVQNVSLLYAKAYKKFGHEVALSFVYKPDNADDLGAGARYFFEYSGQPNLFKKIIFFSKHFLANPILYFSLLKKYFDIYPKLSGESILYAAYGVWIDEVIREFKPGLITSQAALIKTFMAAQATERHQIPIVFEPYAEIHDLEMGVNKNLSEDGRKKYWNYYLGLAAMVIGMDNCSVGPLMYLPEEKVKVFYDACNFEYYQKELEETKEEVRRSYNLPQDKFLLAMTGAYHYRKGHDQLIKAISILHKKGFTNIGAVLVGMDVGKEKWMELAKTEGVEDSIFFLQNLNEEKKWRLYKSVEGYCNFSNSTRSCGLDLALLEAMSCALPIVVYDNGALPSAVPEGKNGYVLKTGDISGMADSLSALYKKTRDERMEMGEESRRFASKTDINVTAKIKLGWFEEIVRNFNHL